MYNNIFRNSYRLYDNVKHTVEPGMPQMTIWRRSTAGWITKTTVTHLPYVILIAFLPQQWLEERASM